MSGSRQTPDADSETRGGDRETRRRDLLKEVRTQIHTDAQTNRHTRHRDTETQRLKNHRSQASGANDAYPA